jgi:tyrosine-protein kinase Etk/Wzc
VDFYAALLASRELREEVIRSPLGAQPEGGLGQATYIEINGIRGTSPRDTVQRALDRLDRQVTVSTNIKANLVSLRTSGRTPELAEQLNRRFLERVNAFNREKRQSKGAAERAFVEQQLATSQAELLSAEGEMEDFLERNRRVGASPQLAFQRARLQQRIDQRQEVYRSLSQSYENARIEEVRDIPVITVVDNPEGSARRKGRIALSLILALTPGMLLGISLALGLEYFTRARQDRPDDFALLDAERRSMAAGLGRRGNGVGSSSPAGQ